MPAMYFLEEIVGHDCDAFQRCILWSRYFAARHSYKFMARDSMKEFILEMDDDMKAEYQKIRSTSIGSICFVEKSLFPNFKNHHR